MEWRVHFLHHLIGALMLFSVLHFAEHKHFLEWLDAAMIRVAGQGGAAAVVSVEAQADRPSIVMIERDAFETVFDDHTPLLRNRLLELLAQIDPRRTRVLVVDIDLAPSGSERAAGLARPLDAVLGAMPARGVAVVLGLPPPAASAPGATLAWVRARCLEGIRFGVVGLHQRLGVVSRVEGGAPTLAGVALQALAPGHGDSSAICSLARESGNESANDAGNEAAFYERVEHAGAGGHGGAAASTPLSAVASNWAALRSDTHAVQLRGGQATIEGASQLRKVVFLGGAYDEGERMMTVGGEAYGVQVHAASFTSLLLGTADAGFWTVAACDLVLGVLFGFLFQAMWQRYEARERELGASARTWRWLRHFYGARLCLFACWMLPLLLAYVGIAVSSTIFANGVWLNPGPIIIGMFLHTLSLRKEDVGAAHGGHHAHTSAGAAGLLFAHHPGSLLVQLPLTVVLLVLASLH